jgi:hypothetical protein
MSKTQNVSYFEVTGNLYNFVIDGVIYGLQMDMLTPRIESDEEEVAKARVYVSLLDVNGRILCEVSSPPVHVLKCYLNGIDIEKEMLDELAIDAKLLSPIKIDLSGIFKEIRRHRKKK